jgi:alanine-glyoxylate transaminase/serine-glyoxylate transaminase/serine-pyruvate transaminase
MKPTSFVPPRRTLLGPGPSDVHPRVLAALSKPTLGHLDPAFVGFMNEVKELLQYAFQTSNTLTLPISGPGSAGMEAALANVIEPGDTVVAAVNGYFSGRMAEMSVRQGAKVVRIDEPWGRPVDPARVEATLRDNPGTKVLAFVHAETSTGVLSDAKALAEIAHRHGAIVVVDAVTSLGGVPLLVDEWGIDVAFAASQKCLGAPPGLAPITFGPRALEVMDRRRAPMQSWFFDMSLIRGYWSGGVKRAYHHTAPSNALYGLHEALVMLQEEGIENSWERHLRNHLALCEEIEAMGLTLMVPKACRLPQLNPVLVPEGVDEAQVRTRILNEFNLEIGGAFGELVGKIWRIGLMGHSSRPENIALCMRALKSVLGATRPA